MEDKILNQYDLIIFDCDGILLDVNLKKCEAFGEAVKDYSEKTVKEFVSHCKNNFGISRYVKFREFITDFAKEPFNEDLYESLLKKYASICKEIYSHAEATDGAIELLNELKYTNKKLFVASGSDEEELNNAFKNRNFDIYFQGIFGSPKTKLECTTNILKKNSFKKALFIGDALSDMNTAHAVNIDFIYMSKYSVQSAIKEGNCKKGALKTISTLKELL